MSNSHTLRYLWSRDESKICIKCKGLLLGEFLIKTVNTPIEEWSKPNWFSGKAVLTKRNNWHLDFSTAICIECIHNYFLEIWK